MEIFCTYFKTTTRPYRVVVHHHLILESTPVKHDNCVFRIIHLQHIYSTSWLYFLKRQKKNCRRAKWQSEVFQEQKIYRIHILAQKYEIR